MKRLTKKQMREKIIELFKKAKGKALYYSDIIKKTGYDLPVVVNICNELEQEGLIG